ncbi:MAG TPA: hypothetical protein QF694_03490, partial [Dehalococcoidia bacterium]|nr:hypothetical protein [Dehalococcoidia bacterium]
MTIRTRSKETLTSPTLSDDNLTALAPRVHRLQEVLQQRMTQPQMTWGGDLSILDEPGAADAPIVVRHAMSFARTMREMPIAIEADDLIVGNSLLDGVVLRTRMPGFGLPREHQDVANNDTKIATQMG